jgi:hypothetical protein
MNTPSTMPARTRSQTRFQRDVTAQHTISADPTEAASTLVRTRNRQVPVQLEASVRDHTQLCSVSVDELLTLSPRRKRKRPSAEPFHKSIKKQKRIATASSIRKPPQVDLSSVFVPEFSAPCEGWQPPIAIGASLGVNLSRLELAKREVAQMEAVLERTRKEFPGGIDAIEKRIEELKTARDQIPQTTEFVTPV